MPNTYIINKFTKTFLIEAKKKPVNHDYYLHHITLSLLIKNDKQFKIWYDSLIKISGFQNRINPKLLSLPLKTNLKQIIKKTDFHPYDIVSSVKNKEFKIIKLRHKNCGSKEQLTKNGTIFKFLLDSYL